MSETKESDASELFQLGAKETTPSLAFEFFQKAYAKGSGPAALRLAGAYLYGLNQTSCNPTMAVKLLEFAISAGVDGSISLLGFCYCFGTGVQRSVEHAVKLWSEAMSEPLAARDLGSCLANGKAGQTQDVKRGFELMREGFAGLLKLAKAGDTLAEFQVGLSYQTGAGVDPDPEQAAAWLRRAADRGHVAAQIELAGLYEDGMGVAADPANPARALALYELAAAQGSEEGQFALAYALHTGSLGTMDAKRARELFEKLRAQGHPDADAVLRELEEEESVRVH